MTTRPTLAIFNPEVPAEVHTDASAIGIGAILLQQVGTNMAAVAYYSRQTTADQRCYHSYKLEMMAVWRYSRLCFIHIQFYVINL